MTRIPREAAPAERRLLRRRHDALQFSLKVSYATGSGYHHGYLHIRLRECNMQ